MDKVTELDALKKMDDGLWQTVSTGLSASAAVILLNHQYYGAESNAVIFKTNISNSKVYKNLEAITKQSVVCAFESLKLFRFTSTWIDIKGYSLLRKQRDEASHTESLDWQDPTMQEFHGREMCYLRATGLFQARQSILDRIAFLSDGAHDRPANRVLPTPEIIKKIREAMEAVVEEGIYLNSDFDELIVRSFDIVHQAVAVKAGYSAAHTQETRGFPASS